MEGSITPAPVQETITRADIVRDAIKHAALRGAVADGGRLFEMPYECIPAEDREFYQPDELYEPQIGELSDPASREKVCGVCLAGAVYLAELEHDLNPYNSQQSIIGYNVFDELEESARAASLARGLNPEIGLFSGNIEQGGTDYLIDVLARQLVKELDAEAAPA